MQGRCRAGRLCAKFDIANNSQTSRCRESRRWRHHILADSLQGFRIANRWKDGDGPKTNNHVELLSFPASFLVGWVMLRVRQRHSSFCLAFIAAGALLFQAAPSQWQLADYLSLVTTKIGYSDFERAHHRPIQPELASAWPHESRIFVGFSYIRFDRKQNTRLWPFIFTGLTRSPPASS